MQKQSDEKKEPKRDETKVGEKHRQNEDSKDSTFRSPKPTHFESSPTSKGQAKIE